MLEQLLSDSDDENSSGSRSGRSSATQHISNIVTAIFQYILLQVLINITNNYYYYYTHLTASFLRQHGSASTRKVKPVWI